MTPSILRLCAATVLVIACTRSDAAARDVSASTSATPASSATAAAPAGAAESKQARDSINERADRGRILGDSTAPVWLVEASDFQCPYCKQWHDAEFPKLVDKYVKTGKVRVAFLNMPLGMHKYALVAAEAAMCASVQGKFWPVHDSLFATQETWESLPDPNPTFESIVAGAGVNMASWKQCMTGHLTLPLIQADRERVVAAHVNSTPTFFVGDRMLAGADAKIDEAIDAALAKAGSGKKGGD